MTTNPQTGFVPARRVGSATDNKALSPYKIASGYGTAIGKGDPVKLSSGTLVVATNGADAIGVFDSVKFTPTGTTQYIGFDHYWPASQAASNIEALVIDAPDATFTIKTDAAPNYVVPGDIFAVTIGTPDTYTKRSAAVANTMVTKTGSLAVTGTNNAALANLANNDAFTIRTSNPANSAVTITIVTNQTPAQLLALLNAVSGISATLNGSNFLSVSATDGYKLILADGAGTPLADSTLLAAAGTYSQVVTANAGLIKVTKDPDTTQNQIEGVLVNHSLRDDG